MLFYENAQRKEGAGPKFMRLPSRNTPEHAVWNFKI
jgi:hypothetical protein